MKSRNFRFQKKVTKIALQKIGISVFIYVILVFIMLTCKKVFAKSSEIVKPNFEVSILENYLEVKLEPKQHESSMYLMMTGQEIAKGDNDYIAQQKEIEKKKVKKKKQLKKRKKMKKSQLEIMAHLINGEAGDQSNVCQQAVGQVVLNRVKDKNYPNTVKGVIFQKSQYACTTDGNYYKKPSKKAYRNAKAVLKGKTVLSVPKKVIYQSQFRQGSGIWRKIGTETFCYK